VSASIGGGKGISASIGGLSVSLGGGKGLSLGLGGSGVSFGGKSGSHASRSSTRSSRSHGHGNLGGKSRGGGRR
jgi:hypothetical protein